MTQQRIIDKSKIDNIQFSGVDRSDYPDFCDAYILSADYDGDPMSEYQLNEINEDSEFIQEQLHKSLF